MNYPATLNSFRRCLKVVDIFGFVVCDTWKQGLEAAKRLYDNKNDLAKRQQEVKKLWSVVKHAVKRLLTPEVYESYMGLMYHMGDALEEAGMDRTLATARPKVALFSHAYYQDLQRLDHTKLHDFCFIGSISSARENREWVLDFARKFFTSNSVFVNTDSGDWPSIGDFDKSKYRQGYCPKEQENNQSRAVQFRRVEENRFYFETMSRSRFVLCPAGDAPWSFRFYETIMCGSLPIIEKPNHSYRTKQEAKIKFCFAIANHGLPTLDQYDVAVAINKQKFETFHLLKKASPVEDDAQK